jgi:predicted metal-dependent phosphoesterase TrpH
MKIDLHIHSRYSSDGSLAPEDIVEIARKKGLNGVAITDHDTVQGGLEARKYETGDFIVIVGAEIKTERGEVIGLFLSKEIRSQRFEDVIIEIKGQGGLVVVPHPFDSMRRSAFRISDEEANYVDAIEGYNGRSIFQAYNRRAVAFAEKHNLPLVAGSDAHHANEIGLAGIITESSDIKDAIRKSDLTIFGKTSPWLLLNHGRAKVRKMWRRATE